MLVKKNCKSKTASGTDRQFWICPFGGRNSFCKSGVFTTEHTENTEKGDNQGEVTVPVRVVFNPTQKGTQGFIM